MKPGSSSDSSQRSDSQIVRQENTLRELSRGVLFLRWLPDYESEYALEDSASGFVEAERIGVAVI